MSRVLGLEIPVHAAVASHRLPQQSPRSLLVKRMSLGRATCSMLVSKCKPSQCEQSHLIKFWVSGTV